MAARFDIYPTTHLMRVARVATPQGDLDMWTLTSFDARWRMEGNGWMKVDENGVIVLNSTNYATYVSPGEMRDGVIEQLEHYGIDGAHPLMDSH